MKTRFDIDCEQSLLFPSVFLAFLRASVELSSGERRDADADADADLEEEEKERDGFFPASPHSLLVSFPNLHNFN